METKKKAGSAALESCALGGHLVGRVQGSTTFLTKEPFCFIFQPIWPVRRHKALIP